MDPNQLNGNIAPQAQPLPAVQPVTPIQSAPNPIPEMQTPAPTVQSSNKARLLVLIIFILLILISIAAYWVFSSGKLSISSIEQTSDKGQSNLPANVSCITGINGNTGDNFCSNYHESASKCTPNFPNTYSDGCSKSSTE